jgi:hypothetical protein
MNIVSMCAIVMAFILLPFNSLHAQPSVGFQCDGSLYLKYLDGGSHKVGVIDSVTGSVSAFFSTSEIDFNAIAFHRSNQLIYLVGTTDHHIYTLDAAGNLSDLGAVNGLNTTTNILAADFDAIGALVVAGPNEPDIYRIDVASSPPQVLSATPLGAINGTVPKLYDFSFNPNDGLLYVMESTTHAMISIDPITGSCAQVFPSQGEINGFGATFFGEEYQVLYGYGRSSSSEPNDKLFRCNMQTGVCNLVQTGPASTGIDGCSCPLEENTLALNEVEHQAEVPHLQLYPNPTRASCTIEWNEVTAAVVTGFDMMGQMIFQREVSKTADLVVETTDWAAGTYMITVQDQGSGERIGSSLLFIHD